MGSSLGNQSSFNQEIVLDFGRCFGNLHEQLTGLQPIPTHHDFQSGRLPAGAVPRFPEGLAGPTRGNRCSNPVEVLDRAPASFESSGFTDDAFGFRHGSYSSRFGVMVAPGRGEVPLMLRKEPLPGRLRPVRVYTQFIKGTHFPIPADMPRN